MASYPDYPHPQGLQARSAPPAPRPPDPNQPYPHQMDSYGGAVSYPAYPQQGQDYAYHQQYHHTTSHAPYASYQPQRPHRPVAPPPPPGALPAHFHSQPPPVPQRPSPPAAHYRQPRAPAAAEPEWRESSFISSYGAFTPGVDTPASPSTQAGYFPASPTHSQQPAYPAYASAAAPFLSQPPRRPTKSPPAAAAVAAPPAQPDYRRHSSRPSDDSSHFSIYSYHSEQSAGAAVPRSPPPQPPLIPPASASNGYLVRSPDQIPPSSSSSSRGANGAGAVNRQASLEHLRMQQAAAASVNDYRQRLESLSISEESGGVGARPVAAPTLPPERGARRQPTILMSPPLEGPPEPLHRNRSIDSTWSRAVTTSPSPSQPSFFASSSGQTTATSSPEVSRRPSYATLSPPTSFTASQQQQQPGSGTSFLRANSYDTFSLLDAPSSSQGHSSQSSAPSSSIEFLRPALLSHLAVYLADHVPRSSSSSSRSSGSFSGAAAVSTLLRAFPPSHRTDRPLALSVARALHAQLWVHEADWGAAPLRDDDSQAFVLARDGGEGLQGVEIPTGVVTSLTRCYSPFCDKLTEEGARGGCYAYSCPNRRAGLHRVASTLSSPTPSPSPSAPAPAPAPEEADNWATSVPPSVLDALDKRQVAYQNQVFELVQGEQKYYDDLMLVETAFVEPLRAANPPILHPSRLSHFLSSVLLNLSVIREHSRAFLAALRARQSEAYLFHGVGQLVLAAAVEWSAAYVEFTSRFPMADFLLKEERDRNPRFAELLADFSRRPEAQRRGFDTFHNRATFRSLRYILLLEQILANADADDPDRGYLEQALQVIRRQGTDANDAIEGTKERVRLREWNRDLVKKGGDTLDLELLDDSRKFFLSGRVFRRPEGSGFTDQFHEAHLVLFDNYLVLTKPPRPLDRDREGAGHPKYQLARRPVPLDLVQLKTASFSEPPVPRSSGFHLRSNRSAGDAPASPLPTAAAATSPGGGSGGGGDSLLWPVSFFQLGRFDGLVYFYVDSPALRAEWEKHLKAAVALRHARQAARRVVRLDPLADLTFGSTSTVVGSLAPASASADPATRFGKPTCSTPLATADGAWLVIAGCAEGIFIGWRGRPRTMQQVVHLAGITQCAVLPEFSFLLVIANKVLVAYALEALIPSKAGSKLDQASKAPQRLSGQKDVSFFKVGKIGDLDPRTLVIYAKKSGVKESVFKALEPVSQAERARAGAGAGHRFLGLGNARPEWFRTYKEFFMPSLVTGLHFQRSKLALIGSRGVEIMDLESMRTMTVPDFPPSRHDRALYLLAKRCEDATTMGMFRIGDSKFLLAYSEFAIHVGRHGEPVEGPFIEWESKPETIAYCAPYIFAISPTIVEIRNAVNGRLAQFITGTHISLTYDGTAIPSSSASSSSSSLASRRSSLDTAAGPGAGAEELAGPVERRLHISMRQGAYHVLYEVVVVA
ncbi:Rho guanine nucleotide exchange factor [Rhodotorula kratochvilovae]